MRLLVNLWINGQLALKKNLATAYQKRKKKKLYSVLYEVEEGLLKYNDPVDYVLYKIFA